MRKRTTSQTLFAESRKDGIFPGDIGNMERDKFYYDEKEFNNEASEFKEGWDTPEKTEIKDERDEMGFGIMKEIEKQYKARRAVLLAHALLGSDAPDSMILAQGKLFYLGMKDSDIVASLKNWKAADEAVVTEETEEEKTEETPEVTTEEAPKADEKPAEETVEETVTEETAETPEENVDELEATEETTVAEDEPEELTVDITDAPDTSEAELQVVQVEPDPELVAAFADEPYEGAPVEEETKASVTASKKTGIKHMPQPKLTASASKSEEEELRSIFAGLATPDNL